MKNWAYWIMAQVLVAHSTRRSLLFIAVIGAVAAIVMALV